MRLVWLIVCRSKRLYTYDLISRSTFRPSRRFRTGQRPARRLGTSLVSISRQVANTLPLVTLVDVFCYITSEIMMHTTGRDDQELYITSILYTCQRGAYETIGAAEETKSRITAQTGRSDRQRQQEHPEKPDREDRSRTEAVHEMGICLGDLVSSWI